MRKITYSQDDLESAVLKWAQGLINKSPYIMMTPKEMLAIQKTGTSLSIENDIVVRHCSLEKRNWMA